jgi:hypothetical protein
MGCRLAGRKLLPTLVGGRGQICTERLPQHSGRAGENCVIGPSTVAKQHDRPMCRSYAVQVLAKTEQLRRTRARRLMGR